MRPQNIGFVNFFDNFFCEIRSQPFILISVVPFILKLAKKKDLTINLRHLMDFGKKKFPVDVKVLNTGDVVHNMEELMPIAFEFV